MNVSKEDVAMLERRRRGASVPAGLREGWSDGALVVLPPRDIRETPAPIDPERLVGYCVVEGEPLSKQRPRFNRKNGTAFTPRETRERERVIGLAFSAAMPRRVALDDFTAYGVRIALYPGTQQRKDIDNMTKLVFDGLTGIAWTDDSQVREMMSWVDRDSARPRTEILVYRLEGRARREDVFCERCGKPARSYPSYRGRRYCSQACRVEARRTAIPTPCQRCGKEHPRQRWEVEKGRPLFCSRPCYTAAHSVELSCSHCSKSFSRPQSLHRAGRPYCSKACRVARLILDRKGRSYGRCLTCGDGTTRKEYTRCALCGLAAKQRAKA